MADHPPPGSLVEEIREEIEDNQVGNPLPAYTEDLLKRCATTLAALERELAEARVVLAAVIPERDEAWRDLNKARAALAEWAPEHPLAAKRPPA